MSSSSAPRPARPTARRGTSALLVRRGGDRLLFDCGEGTQRQLLRSSIGLVDIEDVFLTHLHADHYLGLPGMLKTFSLRMREPALTIYGPPGLRELFGVARARHREADYELELVELRAGDAVTRDGYQVCAFPVAHGVPAVGYALVEPERPGRFDDTAADALGVPFGPERGMLQRGEPVTLADGRVVDPHELVGPPRGRADDRLHRRHRARPRRSRCSSTGADVLVHEATFGNDDVERAAETGHSTARQAGETARRRRRDAARADARLAALLRARAVAGGTGRVRGGGAAPRLRHDRGAVPRARRRPSSSRAARSPSGSAAEEAVET